MGEGARDRDILLAEVTTVQRVICHVGLNGPGEGAAGSRELAWCMGRTELWLGVGCEVEGEEAPGRDRQGPPHAQ